MTSTVSLNQATYITELIQDNADDLGLDESWSWDLAFQSAQNLEPIIYRQALAKIYTTREYRHAKDPRVQMAWADARAFLKSKNLI